MRFNKKRSGIRFGKFDPILYSDQKELSELYQKDLEECKKDKKRKLSREERLNLYRDFEYQRIVKEEEKAKNTFYIGIVLAFIVLSITAVPVYIYIPNYSLFIINWLFVIDILFTIYLYFKQYNAYDKLRERDLYLAILDIKKNISDLNNLIENINKKD